MEEKQTEGEDQSGAQHFKELSSDLDLLEPLRERLQACLPGYELLECLGRGGMGAVFLARQLKLERQVAVKVLLPPPAEVKGWEERFMREGQALARLSHPGIVAVYDFDQEAGLAWLVMEYVDGSNLRLLLDDGQLEPEVALAIVPQICAALQFAHDQGIVHRDIKPENVLIDERGVVKIADFGLAKLTGDVPGTQLTRSDQAMGTLRYMAPEQLDSPRSVDHRADIFSLGVVLYEMLTGMVPQGVVAPPSEKVQVDVRLDEVVLKALEREPERRYQKVEEVETRLEQIRQGPAEDGRAAPAGVNSGQARGGPASIAAYWSDAVIPIAAAVLVMTTWKTTWGAGYILGNWGAAWLGVGALSVPLVARLTGLAPVASSRLARLRLVCGGGLAGAILLRIQTLQGVAPQPMGQLVVSFLFMIAAVMAGTGALGLVSGPLGRVLRGFWQGFPVQARTLRRLQWCLLGTCLLGVAVLVLPPWYIGENGQIVIGLEVGNGHVYGAILIVITLVCWLGQPARQRLVACSVALLALVGVGACYAWLAQGVVYMESGIGAGLGSWVSLMQFALALVMASMRTREEETAAG